MSDRGPDPKVERAAVRFIASRLEREKYQVQSRERVSCGYDLNAKRDQNELHVEVKGCTDAVQEVNRTGIVGGPIR
jgi:Protein NO VEIN, C-terminal